MEMTENVPAANAAAPESSVTASETPAVSTRTRKAKRPVAASSRSAARVTTRKKGQTKMKTSTRSARTPRFAAQVLNAAKALLRTPEFSVLLQGTTPSARPAARSRRAAPTSARRQRRSAPDTAARTYARAARGASSSQRGRVAGTYHSRPGVKSNDVKSESDATQRVFALIARKSRKGISQRQIQDALELPHSTVWYALKTLRGTKVVEYRDAQ
jgi:hypothetical protein